MVNSMVLVAILAIALVSAKPVEYEDEYNDYQGSDAVPSIPYQQTYYDGESDEERGTRNVRHAQISDLGPTIQLGDLINAVEHTLVHSNQNLANANATNTTSFNSTETSTVISLPITLPSPSTTEASLHEETVDEEASATEAVEFTTTTPFIELPSPNITIIQTINSTQVSSPTSDSSSTVVRVQQQHITLFSAGAGIFPNLPSVNLDALSNTSIFADEPRPKTDASSELSSISSEEENDKKSIISDECRPKDTDDSDSIETDERKTNNCAKTVGSSGDASTTESHVQKIKKAGILQEKLAEVAADPVILTQGI